MSAPGPIRAAKNSRADWETPVQIYNWLDKSFHFDLDAAASDLNHKAEKYLTEADDALSVRWADYGSSIFINPPYGSGMRHWISKMAEAKRDGCKVVGLVPNATDTQWFAHAYDTCNKIWLAKARIPFEIEGVPVKGNTTGTAFIIWLPEKISRPDVLLVDWRLDIQLTQ